MAVNLNHLVEVGLGVFNAKYFFFPPLPFYTVVSEGSGYAQPEFKPILLRVELLHTFFVIPLPGDLSLFSHLSLYAAIYLYQYLLTDIYFIFWILVRCYLVAQIVPTPN